LAAANWPFGDCFVERMSDLLLRIAPEPTGEKSDEVSDVFAQGEVVGRITLAWRYPSDAPWRWTLAYDHHEDRTPTHGYEPTREAAIQAFARSWNRET
jgi:hypothetical protein